MNFKTDNVRVKAFDYAAQLACELDHPRFVEASVALNHYIIETTNRNGIVFVCGNGGSAAMANHFAVDLNKVAGLAGIRCVSLAANVSEITAWANDEDYGRVFSSQLAQMMREPDMLVAISSSGTSRNIVNACEFAYKTHHNVFLLTSEKANRSRAVSALNWANGLYVACSSHTGVIEDSHSALLHSVAYSIKELV